MAMAWCGDPGQTLPYKHLNDFPVGIAATPASRGELLGVAAALIVIGGALIVLAPAKQSVERTSAVSA